MQRNAYAPFLSSEPRFRLGGEVNRLLNLEMGCLKEMLDGLNIII